MLKITLIGTGNLASHLQTVFTTTEGVEVDEVLSSRDNLRLKIHEQKSIKQQSDIYIIAVSDDAISLVSQKLNSENLLLVHTSGSIAIDAISDGNRKGVFYPLQTFSKGQEVNFEQIPICIESENKQDLALLETLAQTISKSVYSINSEQRKSLHLAAVFVNNFTNHLYHIGNEICKKQKLPFDILKPLIAETAKKITYLSPSAAQTGPAKRFDEKVILSQLAQLQDENHHKIYKTLTDSILKTYEKKL